MTKYSYVVCVVPPAQGIDGEEALFWLNKAAKNPKLDPDNLATAAGIIGQGLVYHSFTYFVFARCSHHKA